MPNPYCFIPHFPNHTPECYNPVIVNGTGVWLGYDWVIFKDIHTQISATRKYRQSPNPSIFQLIYINHTMNQSYLVIESRIQEAIDAFNTRNNAKIVDVAKEFHVPYYRLRSRLQGASSPSQVREFHNRLLTSDQDLTLVLYYQRLANIGTSAHLRSVKCEVERLLRQDRGFGNLFSEIETHWIKR